MYSKKQQQQYVLQFTLDQTNRFYRQTRHRACGVGNVRRSNDQSIGLTTSLSCTEPFASKIHLLKQRKKKMPGCVIF